MGNEYYAHNRQPDERKEWQRLIDHLETTANRAAEFLAPLGWSEIGKAAGLLHDIGKYTPEFLRRLAGGTGRVDHSTAGAQVAIKRYDKLLGKMLAFCIAGHHAGLANGVDGRKISALADRLGRDVPKLDPVWKREVLLPPLQRMGPGPQPRSKETVAFCASFLVRIVFSALVDADYLDTEAYYLRLEGGSPQRGQHPPLSELMRRLDDHLGQLASVAEPSPVNDLRCEVLSHAREHATCAPGMFTLTVPTGGGKTLTSLAFALSHAMHHDLSRVIYVIPYTSIVEQTASVFRTVLRDAGAEFVVEHHSAFDEDGIRERESADKLRLAMENWDAPIVVTTAVQFFESLFSNRPSRCRKLHNIANSVVVLDEVQTLPLRLLRPCVTALDELARNWRVSIVLCTATQPALAAPAFVGGLERVRELAPDPRRLYVSLKRTRVHPPETIDNASLATGLRETPQALCIVNTRRHARALYELISDAEGAIHLTTLLCARHRRDVLNTVRDRLKEGVPVRLIATSLIEAGVDIDFPVVYRAVAGLESIVQAAGRCNREGRAPAIGDVFVFEPEEGEGPPEIQQLAAATRNVMRHHDDPLSLDAIAAYFREVYWTKEAELDVAHILDSLEERRPSLDLPFETIAARFRMIDDPMVPVIVPYRGADGSDGRVETLIRQLDHVRRPGAIARHLQPYVVQVPLHARGVLVSSGAASIMRPKDFAEQFVVLSNLDLYRADVGLTWDDPTYRNAASMIF